jgi:hypothetical protein
LHNHPVARERGTVVSIVSSWHPTGSGTPSRRVRLLVEYDTGNGPVVVRSVTTHRPGLRVGGEVWLYRRASGRMAVAFDEPEPIDPWWVRGAQPVSGLLAYAGLVVLMLLLGGGILLLVIVRANQTMPTAPPSEPPGASTAATPPPTTSATP